MEEIIPEYPMIFAHASTEIIVIIVSFICTNVSFNTITKSSIFAPCRRPPIIADKKIQTPGVLIQANVIVLGFSPVKIVRDVANCAKNVFTGETSLLVSKRNTKIMINGDHANSAFFRFNVSCVSMATSYAGSLSTLFAIRIVTAKETTDPTTTASSAPTNLPISISGITNAIPLMSVIGNTPFNPLIPFPVIITIKIGERIINGVNCRAVIHDNDVFSKDRRFAKVTVGIPMDPNAVGVPFAIKHTRHENNGSNPNDTSILAGIATAVPKPAMPSINPPKHHAINKTSTRLSVEKDVIIDLITSMPPVLNDKRYVNTAAIITIIIGQIAINVPSNAAVAVSITGRCHTRTASITEIKNEPIAALNVGHFIFNNAKASQIIGANPKINNMKLIFPLRALNSIISIHVKIEQFKMRTLTDRKKIKKIDLLRIFMQFFYQAYHLFRSAF